MIKMLIDKYKTCFGRLVFFLSLFIFYFILHFNWFFIKKILLQKNIEIHNNGNRSEEKVCVYRDQQKKIIKVKSLKNAQKNQTKKIIKNDKSHSYSRI